MTSSKMVFSTLKHIRNFNKILPRQMVPSVHCAMVSCRTFSRHSISKSVELWKPEPNEINSSDILFPESPTRPVIIMLSWLMADKKTLSKYANIYFKKGCDVLTVFLNPWQIIWPIKGSQIVAKDLLQYLYNECLERPIVLHGFSVGGYMWGEVLVKMNDDLPKYMPLVNRIVGQIWDSAADVSDIQRGLPFAVFPNNKILRSTLEKYVWYHMRTFYDTATRHYLRSSQMYHTTPVRTPVMIFVCKTDFVGSVKSNLGTKESWDSMGMKTYWKCWDESKHVSHLLYHRDEYLSTLDSFLAKLKLPKEEIEEFNKVELKVKVFH